MATNLLKKRLWHRCFPVNFVKFLRTPGDCFYVVDKFQKANCYQLIKIIVNIFIR